jgi:hypothetical protein
LNSHSSSRIVHFWPSAAHSLLKQFVLHGHLSYTATDFESPGQPLDKVSFTLCFSQQQHTEAALSLTVAYRVWQNLPKSYTVSLCMLSKWDKKNRHTSISLQGLHPDLVSISRQMLPPMVTWPKQAWKKKLVGLGKKRYGRQQKIHYVYYSMSMGLAQHIMQKKKKKHC